MVGGWWMVAGDRPFASSDDSPSDKRLVKARFLLALDDEDSVRAGLDETASLAAEGHHVALCVLLHEVLSRRLAQRSIRRVLLDPADVADAEQTTLIAIAERISSFQGRSRFTTWLATVARNEALMLVRRHQRKSEATTNALPETDRLARRLSSLIAGERAFDFALQQLSAGHRTVIDLRERQGLSYDEIAAELGLPVGTVRSRISRAREALAGLLLADD